VSEYVTATIYCFYRLNVEDEDENNEHKASKESKEPVSTVRMLLTWCQPAVLCCAEACILSCTILYCFYDSFNYQLFSIITTTLCSPSMKIGSSPLKGCRDNCGPGGK